MSVDATELQTEILNFFGYGRKTAETLALAARYVDWAVTNGYLDRVWETIRVHRAA